MNFMNVGLGELLVLLLLGLILFGPEELLAFARSAGRWARTLQRMWYESEEAMQLEHLLHDVTDDGEHPTNDAN